MAGLGGFLTGLGLQMGYNDLYGQQFQQQQAKTQLLKAEAEKDQLQAQQMQQQMKTQKDLGAFVQSQTQLDGADAANPLKQAQMYNKAAGLAASQGDFASAQEMTTLAKNATQDAQEAVVAQAKQQQLKKEDLANTADEYSANPTRDGAMALAKKAIAAGVNPATIPANLNSPEGQAWVNQQKLAGMDSKAKAEFVQKAYEMKATRDQHEKDHMDNVQTERARMQQTAAFREDILALRASEDAVRNADRADRTKNPQIVDIGGVKWERDPDMKLKGERNTTDPTLVKLGEPPLTAQQRGGISRLNEAVGEGTRALVNMSSFDVDSRASPFSHLGAKTPFDALVKVGSQALTPDQYQMIPVSGANLGNQIASAEAAFGGRMANGSQQDHIEQVTTPQSGDTGLTAAYKLANGKEIFETVLRYAPAAYRNSQDAKDHLAELSKINWSTQDVIAAARKQADGGKSSQTLADLGRQTAEARKIVQSNAPVGEGMPGTADVGAGNNAPPIPAGWSVKEH